MATSRYRNVNILDDNTFETMDFPDRSLLNGIDTFRIRASRFDRLDILAFKHLGSGEYWWVIALMNDIDWMYGFEEGQILKIPVDVDDVLRLF